MRIEVNATWPWIARSLIATMVIHHSSPQTAHNSLSSLDLEAALIRDILLLVDRRISLALALGCPERCFATLLDGRLLGLLASRCWLRWSSVLVTRTVVIGFVLGVLSGGIAGGDAEGGCWEAR